MTPLRVRPVAGGSSLEVRLQPRSPRRGVSGPKEGVLVLRVSAPPVAGKANEEARRLLADFLGLPPSRLRLARGAKSRSKVFHVAGVDPEELRRIVVEAGKST